MFTFEGTDYQSKSAVALKLLGEGKGRSEIAKLLDMTYQTVHAVMKKSGMVATPRKKAEKPVKPAKTTKKAPKKTKKIKTVITPAVVDEQPTETTDSTLE
jgi:hypothetical protein